GNAGRALAAYGARAGMEVDVFMPDDTPIINQLEAHLCGAKVFLVNGLIGDCGRIIREAPPHTRPLSPERRGESPGGHPLPSASNEAEGRGEPLQPGWLDMSTLKEPYRLEGKKTMGLELSEQLDSRLPDWIFYPTGGGTGLIGMWKAFGELAEL